MAERILRGTGHWLRRQVGLRGLPRFQGFCSALGGPGDAGIWKILGNVRANTRKSTIPPTQNTRGSPCPRGLPRVLHLLSRDDTASEPWGWSDSPSGGAPVLGLDYMEEWASLYRNPHRSQLSLKHFWSSRQRRGSSTCWHCDLFANICKGQ